MWYNSSDKGVTDGDLWTSLSQKKTVFMIQRKRLFQSFSAVNRESRLSDAAFSRKSLTLLENSVRRTLPPGRLPDCFGVSQKRSI